MLFLCSCDFDVNDKTKKFVYFCLAFKDIYKAPIYVFIWRERAREWETNNGELAWPSPAESVRVCRPMLSAVGTPAVPHVFVLRFMVHQDGIPFDKHCGWQFHMQHKCELSRSRLYAMSHIWLSVALKTRKSFTSSLSWKARKFGALSSINLILIWRTRGWNFLQTETQCGCVCRPNALSCASTSPASLPLRYPSLLPLSAPFNPHSYRPYLRLFTARHPDIPRRLPGRKVGKF